MTVAIVNKLIVTNSLTTL